MPSSGRHVAAARLPGAGRPVASRRDHVPVWAAVSALLAGVVAVVALAADLAAAPAPSAVPAADPPPAPINADFPGLTTFRGNATRTYLGRGPVPQDPVIRWAHPADGDELCSFSAEGRDPSDTKEWCGTGWTGQPNVVPNGDGMEIRVGAFDGAYHFLDAGTGGVVRAPLQTGDLAKGSATTDPDGFPLYYAGSRDNIFRVVALDREEPTVLWELDAHEVECPGGCWNDDWDGAALVVDDHLLEGGENGWFYVVRLHRGFDGFGQVVVDPDVVRFAGYDDQLFADIGRPDAVVEGVSLFDVSIENSPVFSDGVVYFANSGGLVQGWDISDLLAGGDTYERVFRFWTGDDTDATLVMDEEGYLYVASEIQRFDDRSRELGQLMKLDPRRPDDPVVWSLSAMEIGFQGAGGSWSTPALNGGYVVFTTAAGRVISVDRETGDVAWELQVGSPTIASPVVIDGTLILGDCTGHLYAWDVSEPSEPPPLLWNLDLGDCIESTPAVWDGWLYVGTREGFIYGIADRDTPAPVS